MNPPEMPDVGLGAKLDPHRSRSIQRFSDVFWDKCPFVPTPWTPVILVFFSNKSPIGVLVICSQIKAIYSAHTPVDNGIRELSGEGIVPALNKDGLVAIRLDINDKLPCWRIANTLPGYIIVDGFGCVIDDALEFLLAQGHVVRSSLSSLRNYPTILHNLVSYPRSPGSRVATVPMPGGGQLPVR